MAKASKLAKTALRGCLFIGDPHVEGRSPDFRSDDFPETILKKIEWCLQHAAKEKLLPVFLGDIFDKPRDNPTWMMGKLIEMLRDTGAIGIYGNHDCAEPTLTENDSLMLLLKSGCLQLVSAERPWVGTICGRSVLIGGSSYREPIPESVPLSDFQQTGSRRSESVKSNVQTSLFGDEEPESDKGAKSESKSKAETKSKTNVLGIWLTHHDLAIGDYEGAKFGPFPIENISLVVNGHIHKRSEPVKRGKTTWWNPGNISRRSRSEKCRVQEPAVLELVVDKKSFRTKYVVVPHEPFDQVFHEAIYDGEEQDGASAFVAGLSELRQRKTSSGAGLIAFLKKNLDQFSDEVGDEIMSLANEVTTG